MVKKYLSVNGLTTILNLLKTMFISKTEINRELDKTRYLLDCNFINSLANIPVNKRFVVANINKNDSVSLSGNINSGSELHIVVNNTSSVDIIISLPQNKPFILLNGDVLTIKPGKCGEINIISTGQNYYVRIL